MIDADRLPRRPPLPMIDAHPLPRVTVPMILRLAALMLFRRESAAAGKRFEGVCGDVGSYVRPCPNCSLLSPYCYPVSGFANPLHSFACPRIVGPPSAQIPVSFIIAGVALGPGSLRGGFSNVGVAPPAECANPRKHPRKVRIVFPCRIVRGRLPRVNRPLSVASPGRGPGGPLWAPWRGAAFIRAEGRGSAGARAPGRLAVFSRA